MKKIEKLKKELQKEIVADILSFDYNKLIEYFGTCEKHLNEIYYFRLPLPIDYKFSLERTLLTIKQPMKNKWSVSEIFSSLGEILPEDKILLKMIKKYKIGYIHIREYPEFREDLYKLIDNN